jgi:hypothetical protein
MVENQDHGPLAGDFPQPGASDAHERAGEEKDVAPEEAVVDPHGVFEVSASRGDEGNEERDGETDEIERSQKHDARQKRRVDAENEGPRRGFSRRQ